MRTLPATPVLLFNLHASQPSFVPSLYSTPVKIVLPLSFVLPFWAGNQENMPNIMKNICFWKKL